MEQLISKQVAIKEFEKHCYPVRYGYNSVENGMTITGIKQVLNEMLPVQPDNQVHLCDSCSYTYPECPSVYTDMIFGNGTGNDNICACSKYLPPAQPEPCEDAVSRKAVQYLLAHFVDEDKYVDACDGLKHLPPVTPKQRTGKWITQDHNKRVGNISTCVYYYPICSKCGKVGIETYKYCPHCGAKMISEGKTCDCYRDGTCIGTKEIDSCSCGGVKSKCDFYEHVRRKGDAE